MLWYEAGLVKAHGTPLMGGSTIWIAIGMTWKGHEFLDAARDASIWEKAKARLGGTFKTVTLAVLQELLVSLAKQKAGIP